MTPLHKPVTRLTQVLVKDGGGPRRALVATLDGELLVLRLHGRRQVEVMPLESIYFGAIKARALDAKRAKDKIRKEKADRAAGERALAAMSRRAMRKAKEAS